MNARLSKQINSAVTQSLVDEHYNSKNKKTIKEDELKFEKQLQDLRVNFNLSIARIFKPASQDKGVTECINAFKVNSDDIRYLKVFIKALTDKSILTGNP
jgi:hypothetical protein